MAKSTALTPKGSFISSASTLLPQVIVSIYLLLALVVFIVTPFLASRWLATPFLGRFIEPTLIFNATNPVDPNSQWPALNQGIKLGDQILALDGKTVSTTAQIEDTLSQYHFGQIQIPSGLLTRQEIYFKTPLMVAAY